MDRLEIENILKIDDLNSELEFERATSIHGKLRWMVKEDSSLEPVRHHLLALIERYESGHWNNESQITDTQIAESDLAERIVSNERIEKLMNDSRNGRLTENKELLAEYWIK